MSRTIQLTSKTYTAPARPLGSIQPHCTHMSRTIQLTSETYTFTHLGAALHAKDLLEIFRAQLFHALSRAAKALHFQGEPNHPMLQAVQPLLLLLCNFQGFLGCFALFLECFLASPQTGQALFQRLLPNKPI